MKIKKTSSGRISFSQVDMVEREWLRHAVMQSIEGDLHTRHVQTVGEAIAKLYHIAMAELIMFLRKHPDSRTFTMPKSMAMVLMICLGAHEENIDLLTVRNQLHQLI